MKVLSNRYLIPQNIKYADSEKRLTVSPTFKAGNIKIEQELSNAIIDSIKSNKSVIKDIMENPTQKKTFFTVLGSIIVSTAATITQAITGNNLEEGKEITTDSAQTESEIKFATIRGKSPQIEKDIMSFTDEHFKDDRISADKIKLLFNEYCAQNRNGAHLLEGRAVDNKTLIKTIFEELKANANDKEQLYAIISKYAALPGVDRVVISSKNSDDVQAGSKNDDNSTNQSKEQLEQIKTTFSEYESLYKLDNFITKQAIKNINKNLYDCTEQIIFIISTLNSEEEKKNFILALANKTVSSEAVKTYNSELRNKGLTFLQYNNFKNLNLDENAIKELTKLIARRHVQDITYNLAPDTFNLKTPGECSINNKFICINNVFELITSKPVTLLSREDAELNKESLLEELKSDFVRKGNRTTYKNIIAYLYGNKHEVNCLNDFEKHQYEENFDKLINLINDDKIFNNNLFSNHSKLRFIERYVLEVNSNPKYLNLTTKKQVRNFIEALKKGLARGVDISPYYADDSKEKVGVQIRFEDPDFGLVKITLNDKTKMHTII